MDPYTTAFALLAGGWGGFYIGRWHAEVFRARYDMERVWKGRRAYREHD